VEGQVPETLSSITPLPEPKPGQWSRRNRRARSNIPGKRANTLPPVMPGEKIFRVVPDAPTLRRWGRRRGFGTRDKGPIPKNVRDAFMAENGSWTVRVISGLVPGRNGQPSRPMSFYQVRQGGYVRRNTVDPDMVRREMGPELYALLTLDKKLPMQPSFQSLYEYEPQHEQFCSCPACHMNWVIATYMMVAMEPTDRALWQYPAPRLVLTRTRETGK
jgi:hypothetical protein